MEFPSDQLGVACLGCGVLEILVFAHLGCPRRHFLGERHPKSGQGSVTPGCAQCAGSDGREQ